MRQTNNSVHPNFKNLNLTLLHCTYTLSQALELLVEVGGGGGFFPFLKFLLWLLFDCCLLCNVMVLFGLEARRQLKLESGEKVRNEIMLPALLGVIILKF